MRTCTLHAARGEDVAASKSFLIRHQGGEGYVAHACPACAPAFAGQPGSRQLKTFDPLIYSLPAGTGMTKPMSAAELKRVAEELEKRDLFGSVL